MKNIILVILSLIHISASASSNESASAELLCETTLEDTYRTRYIYDQLPVDSRLFEIVEVYTSNSGFELRMLKVKDITSNQISWLPFDTEQISNPIISREYISYDDKRMAHLDEQTLKPKEQIFLQAFESDIDFFEDNSSITANQAQNLKLLMSAQKNNQPVWFKVAFAVDPELFETLFEIKAILFEQKVDNSNMSHKNLVVFALNLSTQQLHVIRMDDEISKIGKKLFLDHLDDTSSSHHITVLRKMN
ncbi:MAG: hypothetical protein KDD58_02425 [Bdellovibrionales bacterium]|nr:hypothetical protein [Bdellovibrionales bacterium]